MSQLRTRRAGLVMGLVGAGLALLTMSLTWGRVGGAGATSSTVVLTGREGAPAAFALSLAALAGLGVLLLVGRTGRVVVGALLVLLGAGTAWAAAAAALDLRARALAGQAGSATLATTGVAVTVSPWWAWVAVLGGVLVLAAGALAVAGGPGWPDPSVRYGAAAADRPTDPWRALDQGVDPTLDD